MCSLRDHAAVTSVCPIHFLGGCFNATRQLFYPAVSIVLKRLLKITRFIYDSKIQYPLYKFVCRVTIFFKPFM